MHDSDTVLLSEPNETPTEHQPEPPPTMKTPTGKFFASAAIAAAIGCAVLAQSSSPALAAPDDQATPAIDADTAAAAKALMDTMKVEQQMGPAFEGVKSMQNAMLDQQKLSPEQLKAAKDIMAVSMAETEKAMAWENIEGTMVRAYASVFTTEEIEGLIALFKSPAGQVFIAKQGQLQAATMREMQTIMMDLMPKIQQKTAEAIERAKQKGTEN